MEELDPRQIDFLAYYHNPKSETFSNALQSALRAGYAQEYAESITAKMPDWLAENSGRRKRILNKAEIRLESLLDSKDEKVVADIAKHATKTLGKEHYSERQEITGKGGEKLIVIPSQLIEKNDSNSVPSDNSEGQAQVQSS